MFAGGARPRGPRACRHDHPCFAAERCDSRIEEAGRPRTAPPSPRVTGAMRLANGRQLPNKQARHPRRICCSPSLSALAAGAGPGIEGHAFRIGLLPYGSLGPAELSPDLAGGRPCARLRLQLANVFAGPSSPLCSLLGHWNLRSELKREFDLITVYGCQTRRASCPGNMPYASASFDEFPSEAIERAFVAQHCRRREDR